MSATRRGFFSGFFLGVLAITGCAAVTYKYYGVSMPDECYSKGMLLGKLGKGGWPDLPMTTCQPDAQVKGKCWVQTTEDFFQKDQALSICMQQLQDCQHGAPPTPTAN